MNCVRWFAVSVIIGCTTQVAIAQTSGVSALQGAWLEQSMSCDQVFVAGKKGMVFRKPVNIFVPGLIISGNRITTPGATCRIRSIKPSGKLQVLSLSCATSVSHADVQALVSMSAGGEFIRHTSDTDPGSRYERCGS